MVLTCLPGPKTLVRKPVKVDLNVITDFNLQLAHIVFPLFFFVYIYYSIRSKQTSEVMGLTYFLGPITLVRKPVEVDLSVIPFTSICSLCT